MEQLQWQSYLLHSGIPATAEVLDISVKKSDVPDFVMVNMWVKLKHQDNITVQRVHSQINKNMLPRKDQVIHIKFLPENMSQVIVL